MPTPSFATTTVFRPTPYPHSNRPEFRAREPASGPNRIIRWAHCVLMLLACWHASAADFNGDRKADILWRQSSTGTTNLWTMNTSTWSFSGLGSWAVSKDYEVLGLADFNGDGKADILWRQKSTGRVTVWLMNGGTILSYVGGWVLAQDWKVQAIGDFNGDGKADVLWRQSSTGNTTMWLMNGGSFTAVGGWVVSQDWVVQGAGDFNGDGKADILWRQTSTGNTSIWLMNGATRLGSLGGWTVSMDWTVQGVGDFNGDGKADILWRKASTGDTVIWLMNGGSYTAFGEGVHSRDWVIQALGDFNGDGKADILWRQSSTGNTAIWLMNGGTRLSSVGWWTVSWDWGIQTPTPPRVTLAWQNNSTNASGFKIERSPDGSTNWTQVGTTAANLTVYQDAGLAPSTTYYYRVRAYNASGASGYSNVVSARTP